ncbi:protein of unassigned function [Methylobacterium oryzae CBMB20]|uniref:Protein of unassigned function n=1 Tax=Methylobacterium oryzae CBMB20 TaxID=693986 RepID=A0A089PZQ1_9HYPH|nr:protein of unassigned function [Methylobacterium oryzae CBMB20]
MPTFLGRGRAGIALRDRVGKCQYHGLRDCANARATRRNPKTRRARGLSTSGRVAGRCAQSPRRLIATVSRPSSRMKPSNAVRRLRVWRRRGLLRPRRPGWRRAP